MALGDKYENNKKDYENKKSPTVYSQYGFGNMESTIDPSKLSMTFWSGMLKISIAPAKANSQEYDYDKSGDVYLGYNKAKLLHDEIELFLQDPNAYNNVGVATKSGLISISNGKEITGEFNPCIIIRQIDDNGNVSASFLYQIKANYDYSIRNFNEKDSSFDKIYNNLVELELFKTLLQEYYVAMSGGNAYGIIHYDRFNTSRTQTKLDSIAEKLGISYKSGGGNNKKSNSTVFDNAKGRSYNDIDLDDIESQM